VRTSAVAFIVALLVPHAAVAKDAAKAGQENKPLLYDALGKLGPVIKADRVIKEGFPWGWKPHAEFHLHYSSLEDDDVLELQHYKGRKKWGKAQKCKIHFQWKDDKLARFICQTPEDLATNKAGSYEIRVSLKQPGAGAVHKDIARFQYKVASHKCDNRHVKRRWKPSTCFTVDYDHHLGEAWLYEIHQDQHAPVHAGFTVWFKWEGSRPQDPKMRCYLGGKKIADFRFAKEYRTEEYRAYKKANQRNIKAIGWSKYTFFGDNLAFRKEAKSLSTVSWPNRFYLNENPGEYRCTITHDGDMVRELFFSVDKEGKVVRPDCKTKPALVTPPTSYPVKIVHKGGGAKFNRRALKKGGNYGKGHCKF
jgi:hypothetical protein